MCRSKRQPFCTREVVRAPSLFLSFSLRASLSLSRTAPGSERVVVSGGGEGGRRRRRRGKRTALKLDSHSREGQCEIESSFQIVLVIVLKRWPA